MSNKRIQKKFPETLSITGTNPFYTEPQSVADIEGYSSQIVYTGTTGFSAIVTVQASNNDSDYDDVSNETMAITGTAGSVLIDVFDHNYGSTRLEIVASAGSGNLNIVTILRSREI